jgi:hypothetical protein
MAPTVDQISIFMENRPGGLAEITEMLARAPVNIRAMSVADTADFGIFRVIVDDTDLAMRMLKENGFTVTRSAMVVVQVPDRPGGLHHVLRTLTEQKINIEYLYAFITRAAESAVIIFRFEEPPKAIAVLEQAGVRILSGEEVYRS